MTYQPELNKNDLPAIKHLIDTGDLKAAAEALKIYMSEKVDNEAVFLAGRIALTVDNPGLAMVMYDWLVQRSPRWQNWLNLGKCHDHLNNPEKAEECYRKAIKKQPDNIDLLATLGSNLVQQYKSEQVIANSNKVLERNPLHGRALSNRGFANIQLRRFGEGWDDYEYGLGNLQWRVKKIYQDEPYWQGEKSKSLYIYGEQGLGDQIAGVEPIRDLQKDCDVKVLDVNPKLKNLFQRSFPDIDVKGDMFKHTCDWHNDYPIDASASMFSVHRHYRRCEEDYPKTPYLVADPERRTMWRALLDSLGNKPKVGIAWSGGVALTNRSARHCPLDTMLPILSQDYTFVNLEYRNRDKEIAEFESKHGIKIHSWPWALQSNDYDDTAALVAELDFIISVPTSIVHLAGALGVKTYCMVHQRPNIHYCRDGSEMAYYGSVELIRHKNDFEHACKLVSNKIQRYKRAA
jgi:hypothetical protein